MKNLTETNPTPEVRGIEITLYAAAARLEGEFAICNANAEAPVWVDEFPDWVLDASSGSLTMAVSKFAIEMAAEYADQIDRQVNLTVLTHSLTDHEIRDLVEYAADRGVGYLTDYIEDNENPATEWAGSNRRVRRDVDALEG